MRLGRSLALREDADLRPVGALSRMPGACLHCLRFHAMEQKHHFDVGELVQPGCTFGSELIWIEFDHRNQIRPAIVAGLFDRRTNYADGTNGEWIQRKALWRRSADLFKAKDSFWK